MRILPYGPRALLLEVADGDAARGLFAAARAEQRAERLASDVELVAGARTLLLDGIDARDLDVVRAAVAGWELRPSATATGAAVEVAVVYDGVDLADVARQWDMTAAEVIATHTVLDHRVAFLGFAPGFAYIDGVPPALAVARRAQPRPRVPAGSVALADGYSAVYPSATPGGWQLVGTTNFIAWDAERDPPARFEPGAVVRFVAVNAVDAVATGPAAPPSRRPRPEPTPDSEPTRRMEPS